MIIRCGNHFRLITQADAKKQAIAYYKEKSFYNKFQEYLNNEDIKLDRNKFKDIKDKSLIKEQISKEFKTFIDGDTGSKEMFIAQYLGINTLSFIEANNVMVSDG